MAKGIYSIINTANGKRYIGSSTDLSKREKRHFSELNANKHGNARLQHAFNKYGASFFRFEVIEEIDDLDMLVIREQYWIDKFNDLYNMNLIAGYPPGFYGRKHSSEALKKISLGNTGNRRPDLSRANKVRRFSPETLAKIGMSSKNREYSDETRAKMSQAHKGRVFSPETRKKLSDAKKGYTHSDEAKAKMSISRKGRILTPNWKEKLSISHYKPVNQLDIVSGIIIATFPSIQHASRETGIDAGTISNVCKGKRKSAGGFLWEKVNGI